MQLKFLYVLSLFLCLSTFASSNECIRPCPAVKAPACSTATAEAACGCQHQPATTGAARPQQTATTNQEEESTPPNGLIRLLYI